MLQSDRKAPSVLFQFALTSYCGMGVSLCTWPDISEFQLQEYLISLIFFMLNCLSAGEHQLFIFGHSYFTG